VPLETRKTLLGHANGDITTHYSAAELNELKEAVEKIVDQRVAQTPTLTLVRRTRAAVGKVSEMDKGSASVAR
jgi:predicted ATPase